MKMTNRLIILTAMLLALASCSKEVSEVDAPAVSSEGGEREIALAFSGSTKATLDGLTPVFAAGDKILLSNDSATETCTVKTRNGKAFIITHLTGPLTMVFPSTAAKVEGNHITGFEVPSSQDGLFSSAVISMAENITGNHATFDCKVPILKFYADASIGVDRIDVQGTDVASNGNTILVWVSYTIRSNPDPRLCYVAVSPGINANTLTFTSTTSTQGTVEKRCTTNAVLQAGHTYNAFIPYYIDLGTAGKWGYCNVGAFLPEEDGIHFAWGDTAGQTWNGSAWSGGGFSWANAPFNNGKSTFNKTYFDTKAPTVCPGGVLALQYDAACVNWGSDWRMPTADGGDFTALKDETNQTWVSFNGVNGCKFINKSNEGIYVFLPATEIVESAPHGRYWSSIKNTSDYYNTAYRLDFEADLSKTYFGRSFLYCGFPIRPVADEVKVEGSLSDYEGSGDLVAIPKGALPGRFTVNASGGKVFFSKGNLYWDGDSYEFEANQYDYRHYNGINGDRAVLNGLTTFTQNGTVGSFHFVKKTETNNKPYDLVYGTPSPADNFDDVLFTNADKTTPNPDFTVFREKGCYRALSRDEFEYLTITRTGNRFAFAKYKDVPGMLIFPDAYTLPSGYNSDGGQGMSKVNNFYGDVTDGSWIPTGNVTDSVWDEMQSNGVVFLPASGYRYYDTSAVHYFSYNSLNYWLSNCSGADQGHSIWSGKPNLYQIIDRDKGLAIRLVADVE